MKKIIVLACVLGMFSSVFVSCSKDEEADKKQIIIDNEWKITSFETEKVDTTFSAFSTALLAISTMTYDFNEDGSYESTTSSILSTELQIEEGTWSISDDYATLTMDSVATTVTACTETTLKLTSDDGASIDFGEEYVFDTGKITIVFTAVTK